MLTLHMHPLASFCWKVLIALYENDTSFAPHHVDLADPASREPFVALWPLGKFPVLVDSANDLVIPESSIIIEYLAQHHPGPVALVPRDPDRAREVRLRDRFFDLYVHEPMQKIVTDRLRPAEKRDALGVEAAHALLRTSYGMLDAHMATRKWATGDDFTMADCAAGPALHFANLVAPFEDTHGNLAAYLLRLEKRPSFARVLLEAEPFFTRFPR
jgi:glutathione S-transferase